MTITPYRSYDYHTHFTDRTLSLKEGNKLAQSCLHIQGSLRGLCLCHERRRKEPPIKPSLSQPIGCATLLSWLRRLGCVLSSLTLEETEPLRLLSVFLGLSELANHPITSKIMPLLGVCFWCQNCLR